MDTPILDIHDKATGNRQISLFWAIVSLLLIVQILIFDVLIMGAEEVLQVQFIPDDSYYYLTLAKNFSRFGAWTFDSGVSQTTGFHLLWAYLLALIYELAVPSLSTFVTLGLVATALLTLTSLAIAWLYGFRLKSRWYFLVLSLIIATRNFVFNSVSIVEWPLVLLFSLLLFITYRQVRESSRTHQVALFMFVISFLGTLSRFEFFIIPFSLLIVSFLPFVIERDLAALKAASWGLFGALTGIAFTFAHNYLLTGQLLQSSVRMKAFWAEFSGNNYFSVIGIIRAIVGVEPIDLKLFIVLFLLAGSALFLLLLRQIAGKDEAIKAVAKLSQTDTRICLASLLILVGLTFAYLRNPVIGYWYTGLLIVPSFVLLLAALRILFNKLESIAGQLLLSAAAIIIIVGNASTLFPIETESSKWPHQSVMHAAGEYIAQRELGALVGAWNAGIIGYYSGGVVVNLDGLVNSDIYDYARNGEIPSYIASREIRYVIDFENMFATQDLRIRNGFDDQRFLQGLSPIKVFDKGQYAWKRLTLYEVVPEQISPKQLLTE